MDLSWRYRIPIIIHGRTMFCITSWIVNKLVQISSCFPIIVLLPFLIPSSKFLVAFPLKCWRSSNTISSLACNDHFTLITYIGNNQKKERTKNYSQNSTVTASLLAWYSIFFFVSWQNNKKWWIGTSTLIHNMFSNRTFPIINQH